MVEEKKRQAKDNRDKLKICFVAPLPPPYGGIANWMAMMCRYMDGEKKEEISYEVINTAPKKRVTEGRTLWQRIVGGGIEMFRVRKTLQRALTISQYDCVHIATSGHLSFIRDRVLFSMIKKHKAKTLYHIHFGRVPCILQNTGWEKLLLKANLKDCDSVLAIDRSTYQALQQSGYNSKAYHIPLPINLKELPGKLPVREKVISFVGWVVYTKGIEELLEAWDNILKDGTDWRIQLIGPCAESYKQKLLAKYSCKQVEFCGELSHEETLKQVNRSKIFVLPSYTEGFPNSVVEAMALGTVIVATRVGAIPEMLDGECGYLTDKQDADSLEQALREAMNAKNSEYGANARKKVKSEYEMQKVMEQYMKLWKSYRE